MTQIKPGWCVVHPGQREPCQRCNSALRRSRTLALGALVAIGLVTSGCRTGGQVRENPPAPVGSGATPVRP